MIRGRSFGKRRSLRGFILLYVVVMVAAIAVVLFQLTQMRTGVPQQIERQIERSLEMAEGRQLAEFVLANLEPGKQLPDPRYLAFRRLLTTHPAALSEMEDMLAQLKGLLEQMDFRVDLATRPGSGRATTNEEVAYEGQRQLFEVRDKPFSVTLGAREYQVSVQPGNAFPNLNGLPFDAMWRFFVHLGVAEPRARELATDIVDWRDADGFRTEQIGAESEYYQALSRGYRPRDSRILQWQELAYLRGMTPDLLAQLKEKTFLGEPDQPQVLIDAQPPEALAALTGLRVELVKALLVEYGKLNTPDPTRAKVDVAELLLTRDAVAFDQIAGWTPNRDHLRLTITGPRSRITADYDLKNRRILSLW